MRSSPTIRLLHGDCLTEMPRLPTASVDMILCDLPYGTTACAWDSVIPFEPLWAEYRRVAKPNAAIVLTASQPFTTALIASNYAEFRYCWVWDKKITGNPFLAKKQPLKVHEDICVFSSKSHLYAPQMRTGAMRTKGGGSKGQLFDIERTSSINDQYYPTSIVEFSNAKKAGLVHPTQKPVALFEYLIRTYTHPGQVVLDNCLGSGTTAVAALNTGRECIGIERDFGYFKIAAQRVADAAKARWPVKVAA